MMERTRGSSDPRAHEAGFSLIEVLIASVIFLFIALSIIPMFTMSAASNVQGQDNTRVANLARSHLDELWQMDFDSDPLTVQTGDSRVVNEYYDKASDSWQINPGTLPPGTQFYRITTVRQFSVEDLDTPIAAPVTDPTKVQIKEITVEIHSTRAGGPLGGGKEMTVRAYKTF